MCEIYLPLRHGAIALAYVNEPFFNPTLGAVARSRDTFDTLGVVMAHFNESLRGFVQEMDRLSVDAKVSCCIIFTALTIFMYRVGGVSSHVSAASNFLRQHKDASGLVNPALREVLAPCVHRLVIDACTFSGAMTTVQHGDYNPFEEYLYEILRVPAVLESVEDAYEHLGNMLKYAIALSVGNIEHGSRVAVHLQGTLQRFEIVLSKSPINTYNGIQLPLESVEFHRKDILLHHRIARLLSSFRPCMLEDSYWTFTPEFQLILEQMKELIETELEEPWRITLGWVPPLFLVATKCRVHKLRTEALCMIHALCRVERGWTSCVAYNLAKFVIEHEGPRPSGGIQAAMYVEYVHLLNVKFDHDGQVTNINYLLQRDRMDIGTFSASLSMKALSKTLAGAPAINVPDPVLQAFGYTGTTMFSPRAECHCHDNDKPVRYTGKVTESGREEVVIWEAGLATFKTIQKKDNRQFQTIAVTKTEDDENDDKVSSNRRLGGAMDHAYRTNSRLNDSTMRVLQRKRSLP